MDERYYWGAIFMFVVFWVQTNVNLGRIVDELRKQKRIEEQD